MFSRSTKKLAESRREGIDTYVQALLRLKSKIVESDLVQQFLQQKATDPVGLDQKRSAETLHSAAAAAASADRPEDNDDVEDEHKRMDGREPHNEVAVSDETSER